MGLRPATADELGAVRGACEAFRAHWAAIGPVFPCAFRGTGADIDALDYLDYEGFRDPETGQAGAALVWGNVVAAQLPFDWLLDDELGGLVLGSRGGELTIWPFGRVYEARRSGRPGPGGKYRRLLEWALLQAFECHLIEDGNPPWLLRLFEAGGSTLANTVEPALDRLRRLAGGAG